MILYEQRYTPLSEIFIEIDMQLDYHDPYQECFLNKLHAKIISLKKANNSVLCFHRVACIRDDIL